jgi:hypothetical protein
MACRPDDYLCIVDQCSGGAGAGTELFNYWDAHNCPVAYLQLINTTPGQPLAYNPASQELAQQKVVQLFNTYFETNKLTDDVTSPEYNNFQNTLLSLCINPTLPGICGNFLTNYCANYNRADAINSPTLRDFCGCYVPPDPVYLKYTLGSPGCLIGSPTGCTGGCTGGETGCTGQPACDPICHRALTSQKAYQPTGDFITCPQTICVIDDVTVKISGSEVPGGINFNSVCSGCGGASGGDGCLCVVSGVNVSTTMSNVGVGTNFDQFCSGSSVCIVEDDAGNIISEGGCTGINPANMGTGNMYTGPNIGVAFIIVIVILIILFISIAIRSE